MSLTANQDVGPFRLSEKIGIGGMGEVWKAHHHAHHSAVAIKVITSDKAAHERYRDVFLREVQAVAALNHPGVVAIYDYGEISNDRDGDHDRTELPWYAMELASTSLADVVLHDWPTLQRILVEILDALAHAHARGVIHRDLKPENVLLTDDHSVRLTDFGMAHVTEYSDTTGNVFGPGGGTPDFMSPEQFRGEWRKFGAWTDLYALGCLAWELVTGHPPYIGKSVVDVAMLHMSAKPSGFAPDFEVPPRFQLWLTQLLQKHPLDRYRRAADAQWALVHDVGSLPGATELHLHSRPGSPVVPTKDAIEGVDGKSLPPLRKHDTLEDLQNLTIQHSYSLTPPFPEEWATDYPLSQIDGAGLGLFGIREIPYVGRAKERQAVWQLLREVDETGENRIVFVQGEPGAGRTRFAQWLARRADELGAATVVRAAHNPIPDRRDGLAGAVSRFLGIEGVDLKRARDIVTDRLGLAYDSTALLDSLYRTNDDSTGTSTFIAPMQRFATVERLFRHLGFERSVIFFADDVQWGADTLLFLQHLLVSKTRTLVIATVRPDTLPERYWESQLLTELQRDERVHTVVLKPLGSSARRKLIASMLDLESSLARKVAARSQGIPLFAVQLVGDWVQRGLLVEGPRGFRLPEGTPIELPDDVYELWNQRIDDIERTLHEPRVRDMLEAAAVLGRGDDEEWRRVCAGLGLRVPDALVEHLVARRLVARDTSGWSFRHGMLREALVRSAMKSGRIEALFDACADHVDPTDPYRKAEFQVRAGQFEDAIGSLFAALRIGIVAVAVDQSLQLVEVIAELLEETRAPIDDPRRGVLGEAEVTLLRLGGYDERALQRAEELAADATRFGWRPVAGDANVHLGALGQALGVPTQDVLLRFDEALAIFEELDDDAGRARAYRGLAGFHLQEGRPDVAADLTVKALRILEAVGDREGVVECEGAMAAAELAAGNDAEARLWFQRTHDDAVRAGLRHFEAFSLEGLGIVSRRQGALEAAEHAFRAALDIWLGVGSPDADSAAVHLALVHFDRHDLDSAAELLDAVAGRMRAPAPRNMGTIFRAGMLAVCATRGDGDGFDACRDTIAAALRRSRERHPDIARLAFSAGETWANRADKRRARAAFDLARNQFLALGEQQLADDVALAIGRLR